MIACGTCDQALTDLVMSERQDLQAMPTRVPAVQCQNSHLLSATNLCGAIVHAHMAGEGVCTWFA